MIVNTNNFPISKQLKTIKQIKNMFHNFLPPLPLVKLSAASVVATTPNTTKE
jgi:hypothetical protein